jgi:hypothetical protein
MRALLGRVPSKFFDAIFRLLFSSLLWKTLLYQLDPTFSLSIMSNGNVTNGHGPASGVLDHARAVEYLREYEHGDGLAVKTLMDSKANGGLTYNDFLILPGYIGMASTRCS